MPAAYYTIGVIDWTLAYKNAFRCASLLECMTMAIPSKTRRLVQALAEKNAPLIQEGLDALTKATQIKENYDDAMAYINLLYRRKAENECGNEDARKAESRPQRLGTESHGCPQGKPVKANQNAPKGIVLGK